MGGAAPSFGFWGLDPGRWGTVPVLGNAGTAPASNRIWLGTEMIASRNDHESKDKIFRKHIRRDELGIDY